MAKKTTKKTQKAATPEKEVKAPVTPEAKAPVEKAAPAKEVKKTSAGDKPLVVKAGTRTDYERKAPKKAPPLKIKPLSLAKPNGKASANPAHLDFPSDRWGLTKDLRKAIVSTASRVAGSEDKKRLVDETLKIGLAHIEAKFERDHEYKTKLKAEAEAEAERRAEERKAKEDKAKAKESK